MLVRRTLRDVAVEEPDISYATLADPRQQRQL
jgi:hypothetical protein